MRRHGPNAPCECGSGKKRKKCCAYVVERRPAIVRTAAKTCGKSLALLGIMAAAIIGIR